MSGGKSQFSEEMRLVPLWAVLLAAVAFFGAQSLLPMIVKDEPGAGPLALRIFIGFLAGTVLGFLVLMAGYVSRDARRRGMNPVLWPLVGFFISNGIGFIIYFLVRRPLLAPCVSCGAEMSSGFNYCPKCGDSRNPTCPQCRRALQAGYLHCPYCGVDLPSAA